MNDKIFKSQFKQDKFCFDNFFQNKTKGTFLEIGALDGVRGSNTYAFECLGWEGICVEPSPSNFELLKNNRNCICEQYAIVNDDVTEVEFLQVTGKLDVLSGIPAYFNPSHQQRIDEETKKKNESSEVITVNASTVNKLLKKHGVSHIDLCSIDTEGGEDLIIKSIDFSACTMSVLVMENNCNPDNLRDLDAYLNNHGFSFHHRLSTDRVYLNEEVLLTHGG